MFTSEATGIFILNELYRIVLRSQKVRYTSHLPKGYSNYRGFYRSDWDDEAQIEHLQNLIPSDTLAKIIYKHLKKIRENIGKVPQHLIDKWKKEIEVAKNRIKQLEQQMNKNKKPGKPWKKKGK